MLAPGRGFEPQFTAPKAPVLPLDDRGMAGRRQLLFQCTCPLPSAATSPPLAATMENGRQSGLVSGTVFKTVRRLLKSLVCAIRLYSIQHTSCKQAGYKSLISG